MICSTGSPKTLVVHGALVVDKVPMFDMIRASDVEITSRTSCRGMYRRPPSSVAVFVQLPQPDRQ